jgi:pyrroline-5-carboxylate reductase
VYNISFIGAGNMTKAMVQGLVLGGYDKRCISVSNRSLEKLNYFSLELGVKVFDDNLTAVKKADVIVLAVKPQQMIALCQELEGKVSPDALFVSVAAGMPVSFFESQFPSNDIVRVMPNLAVATGQGVTALYASNSSQLEERYALITLFSRLGLVLWLKEESQMAVITAVASSGIALYAVFTEVFEEKLLAENIKSTEARAVIKQLILGVADLTSPFERWMGLVDRVMSPGGTTEAALSHLNKSGFSHILSGALDLAVERSKSIGKEDAC